MIPFPELPLDGLKILTDEVGMLQHSKFSIIDRHKGYTTDECELHNLTPDPSTIVPSISILIGPLRCRPTSFPPLPTLEESDHVFTYASG